MKALILCGGKGSRLRPITYTSSKQLIPIANKPIVEYVIENIKNSGIIDVGVIVGDTEQEIKNFIGNGEKWNIRVTYIKQDKPLGIAHAVKISKDFLKNSKFVLFLGDNLIKQSISLLVRDFKKFNFNSHILLSKVNNPYDFGIAEIKNNNVIKLIEKPKKPKSNLALTGIYFFDSSIFSAIDTLQFSKRGELEITEAIQYLINNNFNVSYSYIEGWWKDTGKYLDVLEANKLILGSISENINDNTIIDKSSKIINTQMRGPIIIGKNCCIKDSYIGPYTSIGNNINIINSEIENSIILDNSIVIDIERIDTSLIGKNAIVKKSLIRPKACKLMIGDCSKVEI